MALRRLDRNVCQQLLQSALRYQGVRAGSASADHLDPYIKIGKREVVGFGHNGGLNYVDRLDYPMPAVRWKEENNEIRALREKEKGDWSKLTIEEKKALYRASFCQTFAEMNAPTGEWKVYVAAVLAAFGMACWMCMGMRAFILQPLPDSFKPENQRAQLRNMIELQTNPIDGLASKYDYEKNEWKK
ncbi:Cytochrome c oxidase subunit IV family [Trinorchestia longiramus]|nr:Cytochrome c oxidase subunit IV family [Trinorchestia longiramus]